MTPSGPELRVLILAPTSRDAELTRSVLAGAGFDCLVCANPAALCAEVERGVAAVLITEETLELAGELTRLLARQPPWSDLPVLLLLRGGLERTLPRETLERFGNVTLIDRPVRMATLVSATGAAVRARQKQYQIRRHMLERDQADRRRQTELAVSRVLAAGGDQEATITGILQAVGEGMDWDAGDLWVLDPDHRWLQCSVFWSRESLPDFAAATRSLTLAPGEGLPGRAWATGGPLWMADLHRDGFVRSASAARDGLCSGFGFPIAVGRSPIGVMEFFSRTRREADDALLGMITTVATHLGQYLEQRQAEDALRESESNLNDFFENAAIGLHWVGPDGIIQRANRAELDMLGYTADEYIGHPIAEFHHDPENIRDILDRLARGETIEGREAQLKAKDGTLRDVLISSNALWRGGRFIHTRCFTRDMTARKRAEEALAEADRRKTEFLATLAHELRNPLAPIRTAAHLLSLDEPENAKLRWGREMIERQLHQLTRLVDDLLDVSRITRGKVDLRKERVDLAAVVRSALETSSPAIEAAHLDLVVSMPPESIGLDADPIRLAQVFSNLLHNAAKFTPSPGTITFSVTRHGDEAEIRVRDTGLGIAPEMLDQVFEMFVQGDRTLERTQGGLGIGLTLVRSFVEMHGGTVRVVSRGLGRGSEFVVRLPVAARAPLSAESHGEPMTRNGGRSPRRRVLVVDDNADGAESLSRLLEAMGNEVRTASDGIEAVETVGTFDPDVVLLDIGMPKLNGYDAARRIRDMSRPGVLLVALTGWGQAEDRRRSREAGFDHHWVKPVDPAKLQELLG